MTDVLGTSPERPIIWSPGRPATRSRRRPVDVPIQNFCIFVFPVKNSNRCVKQELLYLKSTFFIKLSFFCWSPKSPLKVPWRSRTLRPLGNLQGTSPDFACRLGNAQEMKFSNKDFFGKGDQIYRKLRIWSHLVKRSFMENFIFVQ